MRQITLTVYLSDEEEAVLSRHLAGMNAVMGESIALLRAFPPAVPVTVSPWTEAEALASLLRYALEREQQRQEMQDSRPVTRRAL
jgi:hypothetical protein